MPSGGRRGACLKCANAPSSARRRAEAKALNALLSRDGDEIEEGPWDRLKSVGEGCQRLKDGESYTEGDDVRECGVVPAHSVELSNVAGTEKTFMRLCSLCEQIETAFWIVKHQISGREAN